MLSAHPHPYLDGESEPKPYTDQPKFLLLAILKDAKCDRPVSVSEIATVPL
jgi:hypothetical protein